MCQKSRDVFNAGIEIRQGDHGRAGEITPQKEGADIHEVADAQTTPYAAFRECAWQELYRDTQLFAEEIELVVLGLEMLYIAVLKNEVKHNELRGNELRNELKRWK
jgi:hypothetical protein